MGETRGLKPFRRRWDENKWKRRRGSLVEVVDTEFKGGGVYEKGCREVAKREHEKLFGMVATIP
jgi:hypothetical protein